MGDFEENKHPRASKSGEFTSGADTPRGVGGKAAPPTRVASNAHALSHAAAAGPATNDVKGHGEHAQAHAKASAAHDKAASAFMDAAHREKDPKDSNELLGEHAHHMGAAIEHRKQQREAESRRDLASAHAEAVEASSPSGMAKFVDKHTSPEHKEKVAADAAKAEAKGKSESVSVKAPKGEKAKGEKKEKHASESKERAEQNEKRTSVAEWLKEKLNQGREAVHEVGQSAIEYDPLHKFKK